MHASCARLEALRLASSIACAAPRRHLFTAERQWRAACGRKRLAVERSASRALQSTASQVGHDAIERDAIFPNVGDLSASRRRPGSYTPMLPRECIAEQAKLGLLDTSRAVGIELPPGLHDDTHQERLAYTREKYARSLEVNVAAQVVSNLKSGDEARKEQGIRILVDYLTNNVCLYTVQLRGALRLAAVHAPLTYMAFFSRQMYMCHMALVQSAVDTFSEKKPNIGEEGSLGLLESHLEAGMLHDGLFELEAMLERNTKVVVTPRLQAAIDTLIKGYTSVGLHTIVKHIRHRVTVSLGMARYFLDDLQDTLARDPKSLQDEVEDIAQQAGHLDLSESDNVQMAQILASIPVDSTPMPDQTVLESAFDRRPILLGEHLQELRGKLMLAFPRPAPKPKKHKVSEIVANDAELVEIEHTESVIDPHTIRSYAKEKFSIHDDTLQWQQKLLHQTRFPGLEKFRSATNAEIVKPRNLLIKHAENWRSRTLTRQQVLDLYRAFTAVGPVINTVDFLDTLPPESEFWQTDDALNLHVQMLRKAVFLTDNLDLARAILDKQLTLALQPDCHVHLYNIVLWAAALQGKQRYVLELLGKMAEDNVQATAETWAAMLLSRASHKDWAEMEWRLASLVEQGVLTPADSFCLDHVLVRMARSRALPETIEFVRLVTGSFGLQLRRPAKEAVLTRICQDESLEGLEAWVALLEGLGQRLELYAEAQSVLIWRVTQDAVPNSMDLTSSLKLSDFEHVGSRRDLQWVLTSIAAGSGEPRDGKSRDKKTREADALVPAISAAAQAQGPQFGASSELPIRNPKPRRKSLSFPAANGDHSDADSIKGYRAIRAVELKMRHLMSLGRYADAIDLYRQSLARGENMMTRCYSLAMECAMNLNADALERRQNASSIYASAVREGLNRDTAMAALALANVRSAAVRDAEDVLNFDQALARIDQAVEAAAETGRATPLKLVTAYAQAFAQNGMPPAAAQILAHARRELAKAGMSLDIAQYTLALRASAFLGRTADFKETLADLLAGPARVDYKIQDTLYQLRRRIRASGADSPARRLYAGDEMAGLLGDAVEALKARRAAQWAQTLGFLQAVVRQCKAPAGADAVDTGDGEPAT